MDPAEPVARAGLTGWSVGRDPGLAGVFVGIELGRAMPLFDSWFDEPDTARNTTQVIIWEYVGASKERMTEFAAQHMFDGDHLRAVDVIDKTHPMARNLLQLYESVIPKQSVTPKP